MDTIFAPATARGKAGVAVVRVSGPEACAASRRLAGALPGERQAGLRRLRDDDGGHIDDALVLWFAEGRSFTGEETVELHLHGSTAVVSAVLAQLAAMPGLRLAEPGEFTRRALENGRLDLAQVEGLADLIEAETEAQRRQALRILSGALGARADGWRTMLIRAAALLEATIDFADEDIPEDVTPEVRDLVGGVRHQLVAEMRGAGAAERIRDGFEVAIVGPPNVGKSTLLNALAGREAAITSDIAGTTRDVIEVRMDLNGVPVTLLDTAGLREAQDRVEEIGVTRARDRAASADMRVYLLARRGDEALVDVRPDDIVLLGRGDLFGDPEHSVSGKTGAGITELVERIGRVLEGRASAAGVIVRERHRIATLRAIEALDSARDRLDDGSTGIELAAHDLRTAIRALEMLVGRVDVEDLLDEIFASFCLGK